MTLETLAITREDSDSRLMTRDSALGKSIDLRLGTCDSGLDSRLDSHDSFTALLKCSLQLNLSIHYMSGFVRPIKHMNLV